MIPKRDFFHRLLRKEEPHQGGLINDRFHEIGAVPGKEEHFSTGVKSEKRLMKSQIGNLCTGKYFHTCLSAGGPQSALRSVDIAQS